MFEAVIAQIAKGVEIAGVAAMVIGFALSAIFAGLELRKRSPEEVYRGARKRVGKSILLGLEFLVAADILRTITEIPSLERVAVLAVIVLIRTFLSFALETEITGRLPWRHAEAEKASSA